MKKSNTLAFGLLLCCFITVAANGQDGPKPWEKYGISQSEWKMIKDSNISIEKLEVILSSGIGINEYCQKPWEKLNINEKDWMDKRRSGMSSYDIELNIQSDRTGFKKDNKGIRTLETTIDVNRQVPDMLKSFFLPGYQQQRIGQKTRGRIMSGLAICAFAGSFVWSVADGELFQPTPLLLLIPDMFWSLLDYKNTLKKKESE